MGAHRPSDRYIESCDLFGFCIVDAFFKGNAHRLLRIGSFFVSFSDKR